jgi:serine/threonine protein kinase
MRCQHKNITNYVASYLMPNTLWLVMEYVKGVTLSASLAKFPLYGEEVATVTQGILRALDFLHANNVVHRDVKPGNVMIAARGEVKLTDFGLATEIETGAGMCVGRAGTLQYTAPEVLAGFPYDASVDVWSLGMTVLEMVRGPESESHPRHYHRLEGPDTTSTELILCQEPMIPTQTSPVVVRFLRCCLAKEPMRRYPASALLQHALMEDFYGAKDILIDLVIRTNKYLPVTIPE